MRGRHLRVVGGERVGGARVEGDAVGDVAGRAHEAAKAHVVGAGAQLDATARLERVGQVVLRQRERGRAVAIRDDLGHDLERPADGDARRQRERADEHLGTRAGGQRRVIDAHAGLAGAVRLGDGAALGLAPIGEQHHPAQRRGREERVAKLHRRGDVGRAAGLRAMARDRRQGRIAGRKRHHARAARERDEVRLAALRVCRGAGRVDEAAGGLDLIVGDAVRDVDEEDRRDARPSRGRGRASQREHDAQDQQRAAGGGERGLRRREIGECEATRQPDQRQQREQREEARREQDELATGHVERERLVSGAGDEDPPGDEDRAAGGGANSNREARPRQHTPSGGPRQPHTVTRRWYVTHSTAAITSASAAR